jgi:hypothetical protein
VLLSQIFSVYDTVSEQILQPYSVDGGTKIQFGLNSSKIRNTCCYCGHVGRFVLYCHCDGLQLIVFVEVWYHEAVDMTVISLLYYYYYYYYYCWKVIVIFVALFDN